MSVPLQEQRKAFKSDGSSRHNEFRSEHGLHTKGFHKSWHQKTPHLAPQPFFFTKLTFFVPFRLCWHQQKRQQNTVTAFTEIRPIQILKDVCPTPCGLSYTITLEWIESLLRNVKQSNTMVLCPYSTTHTTALTNAKRIASSFISRCLWKHMVQYYWRSAKWT